MIVSVHARMFLDRQDGLTMSSKICNHYCLCSCDVVAVQKCVCYCCHYYLMLIARHEMNLPLEGTVLSTMPSLQC